MTLQNVTGVDRPDLYAQRGLTHLALGNYAEARDDLDAASPDELKTVSALILALEALGRFGEANRVIDRLSRTEERAPTEAVAEELNQRAFLHYVQGRFEDAVADFDAAQRIKSNEKNLIFAHLARRHTGAVTDLQLQRWKSPFEPTETKIYWPDAAILFLQEKLSAEAMLAAPSDSKSESYRASAACEGHVILAELARIARDEPTERRHLAAALATKVCDSQSFVLALIRNRELEESAAP